MLPERIFCFQLTDQMDEELHNLMLNLLRIGKQRVALRTLFLQWLESCIKANRGKRVPGVSNNRAWPTFAVRTFCLFMVRIRLRYILSSPLMFLLTSL